MKLMKSALLGTAAGIVAIASAQAADLPSRKSAPVEYVKVCDVYGAGFFYIPGTDTCLKIGGRVRFEMAGQTIDSAIRSRSAGGTNQFLSKNGIDQLGWNARGYLNMDARTQSAWGTVQTVIVMRVNSASGVLANNYNVGLVAAPAAFSPTLENAYIRFAGFTFGRAYSNFTTIPPYMWNADRVGGFGAGVKQLAYTAVFGGGFSATVAIEDKNDSGPQITANALGVNATGLGSYPVTATAVGPSRLPNLIGNLRLSQGWGWVQLSGAVGQNTANVASIAGAPNAAQILVINGNGPLIKKTGWAAALSTRINLPMLAAGSALHLSAGWSDGLVNYVGADTNGGVGKIGPWTGGLLRADRNMTIYECNTPLPAAAMCSENTKSWHVLGMLTHYWTPTIRQNISASYQEIKPGRVTQNTDWAQGGLSKAKATVLGTNLIWAPIRGFELGVELTYSRLNQTLTGFNGAVPSALPAAAPIGWRPSSDVFSARMRVERTF